MGLSPAVIRLYSASLVPLPRFNQDITPSYGTESRKILVILYDIFKLHENALFGAVAAVDIDIYSPPGAILVK